MPYQVTSKGLRPIRLKQLQQAMRSGVRIQWVKLKKRHDLMDNSGAFPTGLLYRVKNALLKEQWQHETVDARKRPKVNSISETSLRVKPRDYEPYPEQRGAALAALKYERGIIVGPTGVGKSVIVELICDAIRVNTLIVVPTLELKRQLTESLRDAFGAHLVGPLAKKQSDTFYPISVENVDSLNPEKKLVGFDCVIIDEYHHSASETYRKLNLNAWIDVFYKFGLTATPFRSSVDERLLLESVLSKVIYEIPYALAVERGYIVPLEVYYIDLPKVEVEVEVSEKGRKRVKAPATYSDAYDQYIINNKLRNAIITRMAASLIEQGIPTLVLVKQIEHGLLLQSMLEAEGLTVPFAEGSGKFKSEYIRAFNQLLSPGLIGTTGVLGEGVDTKPAEWVFLAAGGKSKNQFMQNLGRVFRRHGSKESGKALLFRDRNNKWLLEHFKKCVSYLMDEFGVEPQKLDLNLSDLSL